MELPLKRERGNCGGINKIILNIDKKYEDIKNSRSSG